MLEAYIKDCGGIVNIHRILSSHGQIILEIENSTLVKKSCLTNYSTCLSQVSFTPETAMDTDQLMKVGSAIKAQQLTAVHRIKKSNHDPFRPNWHISPVAGLLNDPNGFIHHNGLYHLFYQWSPFECAHKDKYWAHITSEDLIHWDWQPIALTPSDWFDSHGVFSGHAISTPEQLMLFYTGNVRIGEQRERQTTQCLAVSSDGINFNKLGPVISDLPEGVTPHCRDPKVMKIGSDWWMLLGVQRQDMVGRLAIYKSKDLHHWVFDKLYGDELGEFGYMWECPDIFELDNQLITLIGPQGILSDSPHHTSPHHNGYLKTSISSQGKLVMNEFKNLDYGFDFYAPQTLEMTDGRRVLTAWMGLPDETNHPSVDYGWLHQLTSMRELQLINGHLFQNPIEEMKVLRQSITEFTLDNSTKDIGTKSFELQVELNWGNTLTLFKDDHYQCLIHLDPHSKTLRLDRSNTLIREGDTLRELSLQSNKVTLRILADCSSIEVFINHGEQVMTSRVFTPEHATQLALTGTADFKLWPLAAASTGLKP